MVDIQELDTVAASETPVEVELRHPVTEEGLGIFVTMKGVESLAFRKKLYELGNRRLKNKGLPESIEKTEAQSIELLVAITVSWRGMVERGEEVEFSPEAAFRIYKNYPWIRKQVDEAAGTLSNFLGK